MACWNTLLSAGPAKPQMTITRPAVINVMRTQPGTSPSSRLTKFVKARLTALNMVTSVARGSFLPELLSTGAARHRFHPPPQAAEARSKLKNTTQMVIEKTRLRMPNTNPRMATRRPPSTDETLKAVMP